MKTFISTGFHLEYNCMSVYLFVRLFVCILEWLNVVIIVEINNVYGIKRRGWVKKKLC